jgi:hypothetical protein
MDTFRRDGRRLGFTGRPDMSAAALPALMTTEEMLALPDNGVERELIGGQLRERPGTRRNRDHCESSALLTSLMVVWLRQQPEPRGLVVVGEAGFRLQRGPDTSVAIDVA